MTPVSPVISPELESEEVVYAKDQPEYRPFPSHRRSDGMLLSRWVLTHEERLAVANGSDIWMYTMTFMQPLQPVLLEVSEHDRSILDVAEYMGLTSTVEKS